MRGIALSLVLLAAACSPQTPRGAPVAAPNQTGQGEEAPMKQRLMVWDDLLGRPKVSPQQTIRWGQGATDLVDVWLPDGAGPHPVVLMVHGGCWQKAIADRTLMNWAAEDLRKQGLAVWNIEYRGVDETGGGYPGTFLDVAHAADALRDHAAALHLDTSHIVAFGHSAGGHLVMWLAARANLPKTSPLYMDNPLKLAGVVNSGGLADLKVSAGVTQRECLASILDQLTGPLATDRADVFSDTSPVEMFPLRVRQVAVNGDKDAIAPARLGEDIVRKAKAAGDHAEVVVVGNTGHVELISPGSSAFAIETAKLKELLAVSH
jgi:acetyl esterase/lipase